MWKIKDPELKAKVNAFFSDEEINNAFVINTDCYKYFRLSTNINKSCFTFAIDKDLMEFIPDYDPDGWNPFPQVTPPSSKYCLVYLSGDFENTISVDKYKADLKGWLTYCNKDVLAFRPLNVDPPASEDLMRWGKIDN